MSHLGCLALVILPRNLIGFDATGHNNPQNDG